MKPKDLMLGNYLMWNRLPWRVAQVTTPTIAGDLYDGWILENGEENVGEPISITSELLTKIGFKKKGSRYGVYEDYFDMEVYQYSDGIWIAYYHNCEVNTPDEQLLVSYVHQLQNAMLMFGVDKEIELKYNDIQ